MEYIRTEPSTLTLPKIKGKKVTLIWANDGWCYIPQLNIRQRFTETHYYHESWTGIIAMPEYIEEVERTLYSKEPLIWRENDEVYSQKKKNVAYTFKIQKPVY